VSPQNVLISYEGDIKLCDFGIAKAASKASHTMAGALKGKLQYMSPEQAWGKSIDKRSDIFALAAVLFELLTGEKLFTGDSELSVLEQVREARVRPPSSINDEVTPDVDAIVLKALAKEQEARYETAGEMAKDLDRVLFNMRPTPSSADLAIYLNRIYSEQPVSHVMGEHVVEESHDRDRELSIPAAPPPQIVVPAPVAAPAPAPAHAPAPAATFAAAEPVEEKKPPIAAIGIAAVVLIGIVGGGLYFMKGKGAEAPTATATAAAVTTTATATAAPATITDSATTTANATADQAMIDEEVKRRLAEEKLKLDQQRAQDQAKAQAAQQGKAPQTPVETASATPAEQPAQQAPAPEPPPVAAAQPAPVETPAQPAPRPAQPAVAQVKEGDLVPIGTPGLISPKLDKLFKAPYPNQARMSKVEGTVTVQVLVSETGTAVDAKVLRGVPQLNDAALEMARRSTFRPATKDGVRVRSYYNMTIPFKL
jgi:TonB family protein